MKKYNYNCIATYICRKLHFKKNFNTRLNNIYGKLLSSINKS